MGGGRHQFLPFGRPDPEYPDSKKERYFQRSDDRNLIKVITSVY